MPKKHCATCSKGIGETTMKTPKQILFQRHRPAAPRLDSIRESALAALRTQPASGDKREALAISGWRVLLGSFRWHLAGLSGAWLMIVVLNSDHGTSQPVR